jgi:hypothetical protein
MNNHFHSALAKERARDFAETGEARRTIRRLKRERAQAGSEAQGRPQPSLNGHGGRLAALLRLRPWLI